MTAENRTKRPHYVPAVYLRAWSNDNDQVVVRHRGTSKVYTPNVINVAVNAGLYGQGALGRAREEMFNKIEVSWPALRSALVADGGMVDVGVREQLSLFAALQLSRTREHFARAEFISDFARFCPTRQPTRDDVRSFLAQSHLRSEPSDREVEAAWTLVYVTLQNGDPPTKDEVFKMLVDVAVRVVGPRLALLKWTVEHCRKPTLFTGDQPVMYWRHEVYATNTRASAWRRPMKFVCR